MKRIALGTFACFAVSVGMYHLGIFHFSADIVTTLYTIVGIVFSVGMSLIISVSTREIKNRDAKKEVRRKMSNVTSSYIVSFLLASLLFILLDVRSNVLPDSQSHTIEVVRHVVFWKSDFMVMTLSLCILFYIGNFMAIQDMNREIEDVIDSERQLKE